LTPVCNATPLIHLGRIGRVDLLRELYLRVLVAPAVLVEVRPRVAEVVAGALAAGWLVETAARNALRIAEIEERLGGRGEAETIALAQETPGALVRVDERAARELCRSLDLEVRGTLGILLEAKRAGLVSRVAPILEALLASGFWLDADTRERFLQLAGEG
jgi:predicted nucleic acid-binding protein